MGKYSVVIELAVIERQRIEIEATSPIDAQDKIKELMSSENKCYLYLPLGDEEKFKIESISKIGGD